MIRSFTIALTLALSAPAFAALGDTWFQGPPSYAHQGITITAREIRHDWTGKIWFKLMVQNMTGKPVVIDRNQMAAKLPGGLVKTREVSVWAGKGKPYDLPPGTSHDLQIEFKVGKTPVPFAVALNGISAGGMPLALPDYPVSPASMKLIAMNKDKIELKQKVHFGTDSAVIQSDSFALLDEVATALKLRGDATVRIEGHTDKHGAADHNLKLSQSRAESVKAFLAGKGVPSPRMDAQGFGFQKPLGSDDDQNRRVEFVITSQ
jgi:outer membrane protein OmpA-like peptidoglycan-associated protein